MANGFNFARAPFRNERLPRLIFLVTAVVVLALTVAHGVILTRHLLREREELDDKVDSLEQQIEARDQAIAEARRIVQAEQSALRNERTDFLTRLYRQKSFSWTGLFNELEAISPGPVRLASIIPSEDEGRITVALNLVGQTFNDIVQMVRELEASAIFATVFPLEEMELEAGNVAATLSLEYVEPSADERAEPTEDAAQMEAAAEEMSEEEVFEDALFEEELEEEPPPAPGEKKP